jgi:LmbE family N-acetylglucosaminyl deacetylase
MTSWEERVLVVAPHADDETLGCGGMLYELQGRRRVAILTLGRTPRREGEQTVGELNSAMQHLGITDYAVLFPGMQSRLDTVPFTDIVTALDAEIDDLAPTAIFFPYASHHQDHDITYRAVLAALRPRKRTLPIRLTALYEYPYAAAWPPPALPGGKFYREMSTDTLVAKVEAYAAYATQARGWLSPARVHEWARTRGAEAGVTAAEAFWAVRGWL